jgi:hypothetical protein
MKGYTKERGQAFKLGFDAESKQFVTKPIAHDFLSQVESHGVLVKLSEWRNGRAVKKRRKILAKQLVAMGPELRDDVGMTDVFASTSHP